MKAWLEMAMHDAERRGLPELKPLLEALARATSALRTAEWNADATGDAALGPDPGSPSTPLGASANPLDSARGKADPGRGR
ncbi:MAG TPA: hypothetical protein VN654_17795 [Vicinamibacterales bacterium]|nr:hypothetical protein [Vicinamibacterales bacterium]